MPTIMYDVNYLNVKLQRKPRRNWCKMFCWFP